MPIHQGISPEGLLDESQRENIAGEITRIHCDGTGAPRSFVNVVSRTCKTAGSSPAPADLLTRYCSATSAGRDVATRQAMFRDLSLMWTRLTDQPEREGSHRAAGSQSRKMQSKPAGSSPNPVRNNNCSNKRDKADPVGHASALASELRYLWDHARGRFAMRATLRARSWWRSRDGSKSLLRGSRRSNIVPRTKGG